MTAQPSKYDLLQRTLAEQGASVALDTLAEQLGAEHRFSELFDVRLMQARLKCGLPAIVTQSLDELPEPQRTQVEEAYLAACREVGHRMLEHGSIREAWLYLRPVGDRRAVADALRKLSPEDHYDSIVELALYEGVAPRLGFELLLEQQGVCNAITTFDSEMHSKPKADRQDVAALLVERLHRDLEATLRAEIKRQEGREPEEQTVAELVADRDWLFANDNYHIDTSHLSSVMRFAVVIDAPDVLRKVIDLTEYGRRLAPALQYRGEPPFEDLYPASALFFRAILGENVDEAVSYFREIAVREAEEGDFGPAEFLVSLLARTGRWSEAIDAHAQLIPAGARTNGIAPTLLELAHQGRQYDRLMQICRERDEVVSFAAGAIAQRG